MSRQILYIEWSKVKNREVGKDKEAEVQPQRDTVQRAGYGRKEKFKLEICRAKAMI